MKLKLEPGTYYAGVDRPFFVSQSAVLKRLVELGAEDVEFFDRDDKAPPVNPRTDSKYSDDWDEWLRARYRGASKVVDIPKRPAWLVRVAPTSPKARPEPKPTATPASSPRTPAPSSPSSSKGAPETPSTPPAPSSGKSKSSFAPILIGAAAVVLGFWLLRGRGR